MDSEQALVIASTIVIYLLTVVLAFYLSKQYVRTRAKSVMYWSLGLWAFAASVLIEIIVALGQYSETLIAVYFFLVVLIVELLALGSVQLVKSEAVRKGYYAFVAVVTLALLYFTVSSLLSSGFGPASQNVQAYIVEGIPPAGVLYASVAGTFAAAIVIVIIAALGYRKTRNVKLLSIITGVIVVSIAGTLYIASFPVFLYYSEFFGIVLLWLGFFTFKK